MIQILYDRWTSLVICSWLGNIQLLYLPPHYLTQPLSTIWSITYLHCLRWVTWITRLHNKYCKSRSPRKPKALMMRTPFDMTRVVTSRLDLQMWSWQWTRKEKIIQSCLFFLSSKGRRIWDLHWRRIANIWKKINCLFFVQQKSDL